MTAQPAPTGPPPSSANPRRIKPGHWILLVLGVLLLGAGVGLTVGGSALLVGDATQRYGRYLASGYERLRTTGYALTSPSIALDLRDPGMPGAPSFGDLASVQVRAGSAVPGQEVFIGVAEASTVDEYLRDVPRASVGNVGWSFFGVRPAGRALAAADDGGALPPSSGNRAPGRPADQGVWDAGAVLRPALGAVEPRDHERGRVPPRLG